MLITDVNVLVYAHRPDSPNHNLYRSWLERVLESGQSYGMAELVLSGFLRIVTHPKIFKNPTPPEIAFSFVEQIRNHPNCVLIHPGLKHWSIFTHLYRVCGAVGNAIPDAYLAALAIESNSEWITTDKGFSRFPGLKWRHPLIM